MMGPVAWSAWIGGVALALVAPAEPVAAPTVAPAPAPAPAPGPAEDEVGNDVVEGGAPPPTPSDAPPPSAPPGGTEEDGAVSPGGDDTANPESAADEPVEPAPLPDEAPPPPHPAEPHAWGGRLGTPLPEPPAPEDPSTLREHAWRGRFWLGAALHVAVPLGGSGVARSTVVAPVPELVFGWRIRPFVALHTSISSFAHDAALVRVYDELGNEAEEYVRGRITALDLLTARFYLPRPRRFEPWAEAGAGLGIRRDPLATRVDAAGLARVGMGTDLWLAPALSITPSVAYRFLVIDRFVGHSMRAGVDLGIHW